MNTFFIYLETRIIRLIGISLKFIIFFQKYVLNFIIFSITQIPFFQNIINNIHKDRLQF